MDLLRNKKIVLSVVALLLVAAGAFAAVKLLWREDAREFYFKAESNSFRKYSQWLSKNYSLLRDRQKPYKTSPYERRMEVTADVSSGGKPFGLENADRIYDLIKKSKLVVDTRRQPKDDTAVSDVALLLERVPFIDTTVYTNTGKLYFTIPVLMPDRYFSADINRIDEVYDRFSLPVRPKRLVNAADIAQALEFDGQSFDKSAAELGNIFSGLTGNEAVRFGGLKELTISGQTVKGREVLVSLDSQAATQLIGGLFSAVASDDTLLAYTYGNFADLSAMLDDAGLFRLSAFLDEAGTVVLNDSEKKLVGMLNVRKNMDGFRDSLKKAFDGYEVKNGLQMAAVIDNSGNILDRRLKLEITAKNRSSSYNVDIHTGSSNTVFEDCRNRFIKVTVSQTGDPVQTGNPAQKGSATQTDKADSVSESRVVEFSIIPVFEKTAGTDTDGKIAINYGVTTRDGFKSGADINLDITAATDAKTLKKNDTVRFRMNMYSTGGGTGPDRGGSLDGAQSPDAGANNDGSLEGELSRVSWNNKKLNAMNQTVKLSVKANLPSFGIKDLSADINLAREDRLGIEPVVPPAVQQDKITDLNKVSQEQLDRIKLEAMASFGSFYLANKPVFDAILGK